MFRTGNKPTTEEIGLTHKDVHDARAVRDARFVQTAAISLPVRKSAIRPEEAKKGGRPKTVPDENGFPVAPCCIVRHHKVTREAIHVLGQLALLDLPSKVQILDDAAHCEKRQR